MAVAASHWDGLQAAWRVTSVPRFARCRLFQGLLIEKDVDLWTCKFGELDSCGWWCGCAPAFPPYYCLFGCFRFAAGSGRVSVSVLLPLSRACTPTLLHYCLWLWLRYRARYWPAQTRKARRSTRNCSGSWMLKATARRTCVASCFPRGTCVPWTSVDLRRTCTTCSPRTTCDSVRISRPSRLHLFVPCRALTATIAPLTSQTRMG